MKSADENVFAFRLALFPFPLGPRRANLILIAYASSEGLGEPAHLRSLTRTSAARSYKPNQEEPSDRKPAPWPLRMAGHAQLKSVKTECSKTQICLTRHT